jgi:glycosyltransferase involved in cell wall biosynthesis
VVESRKNYAFVLPWSIDHEGGVNEVVRNLIEEFRLAGEFHPVFIENHWSSVRPVVERRRDYTHVRMRLRAPYDKDIRMSAAFFLSLPLALWKLWQLAREHRIVAFNIHYPGLASLHWTLLRALRFFPGKVILSFHGSDIRAAHGMHGWTRLAFRYLLYRADAVVACSEGLQEEILMLEPRANARVIYNGIDERRFRGIASPGALGANLRDKEDLILNIGRYEYRKAHDLLLRAFAQVLRKRPGAHLLIVGSTGPEMEKTKAAVVSLGLEDKVTLYRDVPHSEIPGLLALARLFVLSSRWVPGKMGEGFPVAILESAIAGRPVVTTRTCGAAEIIEDGVTGRLVPLEDAAALAEAICDLLEHKTKAATMAANLREKVLDKFTWGRAYRSYADLCKPI